MSHVEYLAEVCDYIGSIAILVCHSTWYISHVHANIITIFLFINLLSVAYIFRFGWFLLINNLLSPAFNSVTPND